MRNQLFTTDNVDIFNAVIYAAITNGLTFTSYYKNDEFTIEYTGGF